MGVTTYIEGRKFLSGRSTHRFLKVGVDTRPLVTHELVPSDMIQSFQNSSQLYHPFH